MRHRLLAVMLGLSLLVPLLLLAMPVKVSAWDAPPSGWGTWQGTGPVERTLSGADYKLYPSQDRYIKYWHMFPGSTEEAFWWDINDLYEYYPGDIYDTAANFIYANKVGWDLCEFGLKLWNGSEVPQYGTGWYEVLVSATISSYLVSNTGWYFGVGIENAGWQGWGENRTWQSQNKEHFFTEFKTNPKTGTNWTWPEIRDLTVLAEVWQPSTSGNLASNAQITQLTVHVRDVTGPAPPAPGNVILRPDSDIAGFGLWPSSGTSRYMMLDETTNNSDNDTTYIYTVTGTVFASAKFGLTDPTGQDSRRIFEIDIWVIARCTQTPTPSQGIPKITFGVRGFNYPGDFFDPYFEYYKDIWPVATWFNYSFKVSGFALPELDTMMFSLQVRMASNNPVFITQAAVLIRDIAWLPEAPGIEPTTTWPSTHEWIVGGGVLTIIATIGFLGMIAVPAIAVIAYKAGEEALLTAANAFWLLVLFFGMFLVGLIGS